jgi:hypothetical protein
MMMLAVLMLINEIFISARPTLVSEGSNIFRLASSWSVKTEDISFATFLFLSQELVGGRALMTSQGRGLYEVWQKFSIE